MELGRAGRPNAMRSPDLLCRLVPGEAIVSQLDVRLYVGCEKRSDQFGLEGGLKLTTKYIGADPQPHLGGIS
jgi:hypothetical protein